MLASIPSPASKGIHLAHGVRDSRMFVLVAFS
jgi:hypothetical protein